MAKKNQPPVRPGKAPEPVAAPAEKDAKAAAPTPTAAELAALFDQLPDHERSRLQDMGAVLPQGISRTAVNGKPHWGYWCKSCNNIPMLFPGSRWGARGELEAPIGGLRLDEVAFIQTRNVPGGGKEVVPPEAINRHNPLCHYCGANIALGINRTLLADRIKAVAEHEASVDKHYSHMARLELKERLDSVSADIGDANQDDRYGGRAQDFLSPQDRADLEHLDQTGAMQTMANAVQATLRGES